VNDLRPTFPHGPSQTMAIEEVGPTCQTRGRRRTAARLFEVELCRHMQPRTPTYTNCHKVKLIINSNITVNM